jgi:DNA-binding transcriptional ArsR family regulator
MPATVQKRHKMSDAALELVAERFRVLGEPNRLRLLIELQQGEKCVNDLSRASGLTQANVSRHLGALTQSGILSRRKAGLQVFYGIADPTIFEMCDHVCGSLSSRMEKQVGGFKNR